MSRTYTLVAVDHGARDRYEALYADGRLIAQSEDGPFTGAALLEALAMDNISVAPAYVEITTDYDEEVVAMDGWPELLDDIPASAVRT